ncbi:GNAT family N-acetyltransferase [Brevundimonas aveniformis]|uniref:GNAT family N-acetyltransferase n=1 Tax=Brevundimonas aveniformis TaxID=370977 RepID=UPI00041CC552|nr:GNAT family N-acetyltransferase [Brevundimonas aveniformis]
MTPDLLAEVHATAFEQPWDAAAFASLLGQDGVAVLGDADGFVLIRTVAGDSEILTLAVRPEARRRGYGRLLVEGAVHQAGLDGATQLFLEVAEDNTAALALYRLTGFNQVGLRAGYYTRPDGRRVSAAVLARNLAD